MRRCPELKRLPKSPRFTSVVFRGQNPGSPAKLIDPGKQPCKTLKSTFLSPDHPATSLRKSDFPSFANSALRINAFPFAVLEKPSDPSKEPIARQFKYAHIPWKERIHVSGLRHSGTRIPMSFFIATSIKNTSKKGTIRSTIKHRLRTALNMIVARGAESGTDTRGRQKLVFNEAKATEQGNKWLLHDWTYIFSPTLELYRMPYPVMVDTLSKALHSIRVRGLKLETGWEKTPCEEVPRIQVVQKVVQQKPARLVSIAQKRKSHRVPNATVTRAPPRSPAVLSIRKPRASSATALKEPCKATMAPADQTPCVVHAVQELSEKRETGRGSRDDRGPRTELADDRWSSDNDDGSTNSKAVRVNSETLFAERPLADSLPDLSSLFRKLNEHASEEEEQVELDQPPDRRPRRRPKLFFQSATPLATPDVPIGGPLELIMAKDGMRAPSKVKKINPEVDKDHILFQRKSIVLQHNHNRGN
ncbi:hypothetical protein BDN71DRAFT_1506925 [Pleurotus eryngii]|uniref:Uncharacterized protein n=1 Tax=Pleurotus eryngii TaxID=5323 RepID=A0A9P5ZX99_PLEER|nr:hypothetical protein BDN71DRAFT_1506925 [Pleurotus eryngii]